MQGYTFQVSTGEGSPIFLFEVAANGQDEAVTRARDLFSDQVDADGNLHVDLTFGLTGGRIKLRSIEDINLDSIIEVREDLEPF
jgi:hypothetical protein